MKDRHNVSVPRKRCGRYSKKTFELLESNGEGCTSHKANDCSIRQIIDNKAESVPKTCPKGRFEAQGCKIECKKFNTIFINMHKKFQPVFHGGKKNSFSLFLQQCCNIMTFQSLAYLARSGRWNGSPLNLVMVTTSLIEVPHHL